MTTVSAATRVRANQVTPQPPLLKTNHPDVNVTTIDINSPNAPGASGQFAGTYDASRFRFEPAAGGGFSCFIDIPDSYRWITSLYTPVVSMSNAAGDYVYVAVTDVNALKGYSEQGYALHPEQIGAFITDKGLAVQEHLKGLNFVVNPDQEIRNDSNIPFAIATALDNGYDIGPATDGKSRLVVGKALRGPNLVPEWFCLKVQLYKPADTDVRTIINIGAPGNQDKANFAEWKKMHPAPPTSPQPNPRPEPY